MKLNRHETHDRFNIFQKQKDVISEGCMECIKNVPDSIKSPFYIFAHPRTVDYDEKISIMVSGTISNKQQAPSTRLIWSPRITKPKAQTNSYLFLAKKNSDTIKVIWLLPPRELWEQYMPGKMTHNPDVWTSIINFQKHRDILERPEEDGPTRQDEIEFRKIISMEALKRKTDKSNNELIERLYKNETKQET